MKASRIERRTFPIFDPPSKRGRRWRIYLNTLEVEVLPIMPGSPKMLALLDLLFPESGEDLSTNIDKIV